MKQRFEAYVVVNSYDFEQSYELFTPSSEEIIDPLPRNLLYPFHVYGSDDVMFE